MQGPVLFANANQFHWLHMTFCQWNVCMNAHAVRLFDWFPRRFTRMDDSHCDVSAWLPARFGLSVALPPKALIDKLVINIKSLPSLSIPPALVGVDLEILPTHTLIKPDPCTYIHLLRTPFTCFQLMPLHVHRNTGVRVGFPNTGSSKYNKKLY